MSIFNWFIDAGHLAWVLLGLHVFLGAVAVAYISARRRPATAIAWMLTIIFIPYIGIIAFFLVGYNRLPKARRDKQKHVNELILERTEGLGQLSHRDHWPHGLATLVTLNNNLGALPMVGATGSNFSPITTAPLPPWPRKLTTPCTMSTWSFTSWCSIRPRNRSLTRWNGPASAG
ncbi:MULTISPECIES: PLDc N-terminal domain-containing protein [Arthrobacter]|uniref:PLDc N-terminal domain-containing protein n=1 Tax=Arthrobacter TaxID=1663 RepID=UPI000B27318C|nr:MULTISPECIES: PLDc N-terminal domain-containing protein [Arthrobacter]